MIGQMGLARLAAIDLLSIKVDIVGETHLGLFAQELVSETLCTANAGRG